LRHRDALSPIETKRGGYLEGNPLAPIEMGAGIAASPHCAERRICRSSGPSPRGPIPKVLAHQLRRRFPSDDSLRRGDRLSTWLRFPKARFPFDYRCLAKPKPPDVPRPFLGRPLLRFALSFHPRASEPRRARGRSTLPAPLPDWRHKPPKSFALPVGGDRSFRHPPLPSVPCGPSGGGGDFRPDHLLTMHVAAESGKRKISAQACG